MWIILVLVIAAAAGAVAAYAVRSSRKAEIQKYYDAAYKIIKEMCLNNAIRNRRRELEGRRKLMIYVKWKTKERTGFVFDPEPGIRIGRSPGQNEICIREKEVSGNHCVIFLSQSQPVVQDLNSANGTWIRRGLGRRRVERAEYLYTGDVLIVGKAKIKITLFTFDMANI